MKHRKGQDGDPGLFSIRVPSVFHPWLKKVCWLMMLALLLGANRSFGGEPALTEYQVKALFLINFAKYVDFPAEAFADASTPITISVVGENKFGDALKKAVEGKKVNGRQIAIRQIEKEEDLVKCHILFISASEKKRLDEILGQVKSRPVLTVGETEPFLQQGGILNFMKKEGKVRLEVDLNAARQAKLQISAKLLSVADVVRGK